MPLAFERRHEPLERGPLPVTQPRASADTETAQGRWGGNDERQWLFAAAARGVVSGRRARGPVLGQGARDGLHPDADGLPVQESRTPG